MAQTNNYNTIIDEKTKTAHKHAITYKNKQQIQNEI